MSQPVVVRASSLAYWTDCPRRNAAKIFRSDVKAAGFSLRETPPNIGATVGTAVHAAAAAMLREKVLTGEPGPIDVATDIAREKLREDAAKGIHYDKDTPTLNDAEKQTIRMAVAYRANVAPSIQPLTVEERLEADVRPGLILSGQSDVIAREPGRVRDLKTGKKRGNYKPQLGAYSLLARSNGIDVTEAVEDFVQRLPSSKVQPEPESHSHDVAAAETAAMNVLRMIETDLATFRTGDPARGILPGDPWSFAANPSSILCSEKWCPAHGTAFCVEHMIKGEK